MRHVATRALVAIACASFASLALAQGDGDLGGFYVGGNLGRSHNTYDTTQFQTLLNNAVSPGGESLVYQHASVERDASAWWVDAGMMRWSYLGLEAEYLHLGQMTYRVSGKVTGGAAGSAFSAYAQPSSRGPALALRARLPLIEGLALDLRAGGYYGHNELHSGLAITKYNEVNQSSKDFSLLVGVGAAYTVAGHWSLHVDALRLNSLGSSTTTGKFDVNVVTGGLSYTF